METALERLIALNPRGQGYLREALANFRDSTTHELLSTALDVIEDRATAQCWLFCHLLAEKPRQVRSVVQNDLFTSVAIWLLIVDQRLDIRHTGEDSDRCLQLLADIWTAIAERVEQPFEHVIPLLIAGHIISVALCNTHRGLPFLARVDMPFVVESDLHASVRRCERLGELVREVRSQLAAAFLTMP